jgi:hypothetical protein
VNIGLLFYKENHQLHFVMLFTKNASILSKGIYYKGRQGENPLTDKRALGFV